MTVSLINTLAQVATAAAQSQSQYQLKLIGDRMTAQLNQKIADLKARSDDPMLPILEQQASALNKQKTSYDSARSQMVANQTPIADLENQISTMATAVNAGDSAGFDQALAAAQTDVGILVIVPLLPGFQPDGATSLKVNGLGIQSSASYDLSTPAGQAQANADVSAAQSLVQQLSTTATQNIQVAISVSQALDTQITSVNNQISSKQQSELTDAAGQIQQFQQQTRTQFHLIELAFGNVGQDGTMLQQFETAQSASASQGSIFSILDTQQTGSTSAPPNILSIFA